MTSDRIKNELVDIARDPPDNVSARLIDNDWHLLEGTIIGPIDSPYENGIFKLIITLNADYPRTPPDIFFKTPLFHPNISTMGEICMDILKENWSPILTISKVLLSICSLLDDPNPDDPLNVDAAKIYLNDREEYNKIARKWTAEYAK